MLSTSTWVVIFIVLLIIKYVFIQPYEDRKLYKMYTARDELAIKATQGLVKQNSKEYDFVMDTVNFNIYYTKYDYDFFIIFNNIFKSPLTDRIRFEKIISRLKKNEYCYETYCNTCYLFIKHMNTRIKFFVFLVIGPFNVILMLIRYLINTISSMNKR